MTHLNHAQSNTNSRLYYHQFTMPDGVSSNAPAGPLYPILNSVTDIDSFRKLLVGVNTFEPFVQELFANLTLASTQAETIKGLQERLDASCVDANNAQVALQTELEVLRSLAKGSKDGHHKTAAHPDPEVFDGSHPKLLHSFLTDMIIKLKANSDWYPNEQDKMAYLFSRLGGKAKGQVIGGVSTEDGSFTYTSYSAMVQILKQAFGALNRQGEASQAILSYKQGHKPLADFLPGWLELQSLCQFNDTASIALLKSALHVSLIERLSYLTLKLDLVDFIAQVRDIDTILRSVPSTSDYYKRDSGRYLILPSTHDHASLTTTQGGDAMDLNAAVLWTAKDIANARRPKTDQEKLARRAYCIAQDLCLYCSSPEHRAADCKIAPWNKAKVAKEGKA